MIFETGTVNLEEQIVSILLEKGLTLTTAESCTAGLIASRLVNVPGISSVFMQGYITYSNESKQSLIGVSGETLKSYGAVSPQVAGEMAKGAAKAAGCDVAVSCTGIAGPDGGTEEKPVGLVYIGCLVKGKLTVLENHFQGSRQQVREASCEKALELLLTCLTANE